MLVLTGCKDYSQNYDDENFFGTLYKYCTTKKNFEKEKQKIESIRELLKEFGITEDVELIELGRERVIGGKFRGGFLTGTSGEFKSYSTVIFRWKCTDGRSFYAELPTTKIAIENMEGSPKIYFVFEISNDYESWEWWRVNTTRFRKKPNLLIAPEAIFQATIKISEEDIEKYLAFK